jgi:hypothetical protein
MKQGASERKRIQHFGSFIERVNLDRSERNRAGPIIAR